MLLGLPLFRVLMLIVLLISIALPFMLITHARHARALVQGHARVDFGRERPIEKEANP